MKKHINFQYIIGTLQKKLLITSLAFFHLMWALENDNLHEGELTEHLWVAAV